ncbi:DUF5343 domain-containing protein [Methylovirgula sp. 4M-Z18]|uniref:DUF5343 domain-containing protein n=1 Tax=Methylovirgula sp. 4M-Z18 TaxID=2293567 RepID=UPI0011C023C1|nr:DUF5343 domain-containing protein [Methylovirgula sp. 4M-Z18]
MLSLQTVFDLKMGGEDMAESSSPSAKSLDGGTKEQSGKSASAPRKIPGNLPYLPASGTLKKALDRLIEAARPPKFNPDFLENVLKLKGGSARNTIPILKRMGLLTSEGVPTELYAKFRTESGRGEAALQALRNGFPEIFKRSEYAHAVEDNKLRDIVMEITGLNATDPVAQAIRNTFKVVKSFIPPGFEKVSGAEEEIIDEITGGADVLGVGKAAGTGSATVSGAIARDRTIRNEIGLTYNINIVLPETSDLKVLNAIFRSIKENLM